MNGPTPRWLIPIAALICSIPLATTAFADAPAAPGGPAGGQIRLLAPPPMPLPIMLVETAPQPALELRIDSNSAAPTAVPVPYMPAPADSVPVQSAARADRVSYVLAPGEPVSVQSTATATQEAAYSPGAPYEGASSFGPQVRAQATASFDATNGYSVSVTLCVSDAQNQPVPNDVLSLTIRSALGRVLFGANITTGENGCYTGTLALGPEVTELPVQMSDVDQFGITDDVPISPPR